MNKTVTDPQPIQFFGWLIFGLLSLFTSIVGLILQPEILLEFAVENPKVIAWVHLIALGWLCTLFFAAGYQLTPVVTFNPLFSKWMSRTHLLLHTVGVPLMVFAFYHRNYPLLAISGIGVIIGFLLFATNAVMSAGLKSQWNHLSIMWYSAVSWLIIGAVFAIIAMLMRLQIIDSPNFREIVGLHVHTLIGGFFLMILIAAASKLVPMFMLSDESKQLGTWVAGIFLNLVLFGAHFSSGFGLLTGPFRTALMIVVLVVVAAYFAQLAYFILCKRKAWDAGMFLFYGSNLTLFMAWLMFYKFHSQFNASAFSYETIRNGVFIINFLSFNGCILGMAQKIVPFMMWHHLYAQHIGKFKVPQTIEFLNVWTLWPIAISYFSSTLLFGAAFFMVSSPLLIQFASVSMLLAFFFTACNGPKFIEHWRKPKLEKF